MRYINWYLPLWTDKDFLDLLDSFPYLLLCPPEAVQIPLRLLHATLHAFQLLPTDPFLSHIRVAVFQ